MAGARGRAAAVGDRVELARRVAADVGARAEVFVTERPGHARELAQTSRDAGARLVVAWGGDGTVNEVATALAFGDAALAIVPAGSGNGLARALNISLDPPAALSAALRGTPRAIDAGELGGRLFVNVAGIGFDAHVAARFNGADNRRRGFGGYAIETARAAMRYPAAHYVIVTPEARVSVRALFVVLANGSQYGNRIRIAPQARVDDGALDLVVVEEHSRLATLWHMRRLITGSVDRAPQWSSRAVQQASIESDAPMMFHVDGEPAQGGRTLDARVHPGALKICF
jgi:YegS/Rv2252/BmrU family lipid kinase